MEKTIEYSSFAVLVLLTIFLLVRNHVKARQERAARAEEYALPIKNISSLPTGSDLIVIRFTRFVSLRLPIAEFIEDYQDTMRGKKSKLFILQGDDQLVAQEGKSYRIEEGQSGKKYLEKCTILIMEDGSFG